MRFAANQRTPACARRCGTQVMQLWELSEEDIDTVGLLISELTTNAVKFTATDLSLDSAVDEDIHLELTYSPGKLIVSVTDCCSETPVVRTPTTDAESGRGMMLVEALSLEWSWNDLPDGGKSVYCIIALQEKDHHEHEDVNRSNDNYIRTGRCQR
jgi:anti-sigma regulatory factor (Ser/Thr protein kinase)